MFPCGLPAFCDVRAVRISFFFNRVEQRHILELLETTRTRSVSRTPVFMLWTLRNPHVSMKEENLGKWHDMAVALICVKQEWIPVEGEHCIVASKREKNAVVYRRGLGEFERREVLAHPPSVETRLDVRRPGSGAEQHDDPDAKRTKGGMRQGLTGHFSTGERLERALHLRGHGNILKRLLLHLTPCCSYCAASGASYRAQRPSAGKLDHHLLQEGSSATAC